MANPNIPVKFTQIVRFDWFIKYMFRDKADFEILEGFLSELLKENVTILEILESESNPTKKDDKFNRVDILVKTAKDERIIVEIQNNEEYDSLYRILFGACKTIVENMHRGFEYSLVKKVISVNIVYFEVGQGLDYIYHGDTRFRGIHLKDELILTPEQRQAFDKQTPQEIFPEYYLIKAFNFDDKVREGLDEWVYLFKNSQIEDHFNAKGIQKAKQKLAVAQLSKRKRTEYEQYVRNLHDEASWNAHQQFKNETVWKFKMDKAVADAEAKAQIKAKQAVADAEVKAKTEVAQNLLKNGLTLELVAAATGLSIEAIPQIKS
jgi:predicted transposase/invertase (TIGR01784 family)